MRANTNPPGQDLAGLLKTLEEQLDALSRRLGDCCEADVRKWRLAAGSRQLARFAPHSPLIAAICGGGSAGKSTLFNALAGGSLSPAGGRAGMNRRVLIGAGAGAWDRTDALERLFGPFGWQPRPLADPQDLTRPGDPLFCRSAQLPSHVLLLDTPDFDTGARGVYTNRETARKALELADLMIYVFTNSNYANRDNTDFIAEMLTGVGQRKAFLVYRVYPSFSSREVREHAMTVAHNIYGPDAEKYLLGIYRVDEDNRVAAGRRLMAPRPLDGDGPALLQALRVTDLRKIRLALYASVFRDLLSLGRRILDDTRLKVDELELYRDALQAAQSHCVQTALKHFPMDRVMRRFVRIWSAGDPAHVRFMRRTGKALSFPVKLVSRLLGSRPPTSPDTKAHSKGAPPVEQRIRADILEGANRLYELSLGSRIKVQVSTADPLADRIRRRVARIRTARRDDHPLPQITDSALPAVLACRVAAPAAVAAVQEHMRRHNWKRVLDAIAARSTKIVTFSDEIDRELGRLAADLRSRMTWRTRLTQTFAAFLNVLPATAAVTYILSTGDPVGAAGIKIKLTGLFGLHDLYALVALPATSGMKQADRRQLEQLLAPVAQVWFNSRLQAVQHIFRKEISGGLIDSAREDAEAAHRLITAVEKNLVRCKNVWSQS